MSNTLYKVDLAEKQEKSFMDECRAQSEEGTGKFDYSSHWLAAEFLALASIF